MFLQCLDIWPGALLALAFIPLWNLSLSLCFVGGKSIACIARIISIASIVSIARIASIVGITSIQVKVLNITLNSLDRPFFFNVKQTVQGSL